MKTNAALAPLDRALGTWNVTGSHPHLPGRALRGRVTFERIEGGAFVRMTSKIEDPDIPEGIALFGTDDQAGTCTMLYFDSRGVSRHYDISFEEDAFVWSRDFPDFSQRLRVTMAKDGNSMEAQGTMKKAGSEWEPDIRLSYVRRTGGDE